MAEEKGPLTWARAKSRAACIHERRMVDQTGIDAASERAALDAPLSPVGTPPNERMRMRWWTHAL
jgi:hypothetical protein